MVVVGQGWSQLVREIAHTCKAALVPITVAQFADTETCVSLQDSEKIENASVLLAYQMTRFAYNSNMVESLGSFNDQLVGVLATIDLVRLMKAHSIVVLLPYLPYARQDESVCKRYQGAVFMLGRCLKALGVQMLATCDLHAPDIVDTYPVKIHHFSTEDFWKPVVLEHIIKDGDIRSFCIVSPDKGGEARAHTLATLLKTSHGYMRKVRLDTDIAKSLDLVGDVKGKQVILLDDIIDTGRTATSACDLLLKSGARAVHGCFTHGVFSRGSVHRLAESNFESIFVTDSIVGTELEYPSKVQVISLNGFLASRVAQWVKDL